MQLYKNNTDFKGHSYGCHDNYLLPRTLPFSDLVTHLIPFLVTRQIFAGAGKVGVENGSHYTQKGFQLSQRADFFEVEVSIDTMHARPILNSRDEPHADASRYRRLHLILGDSNMSEYATALKIGTTSLMLQLIEQGLAPKAAGIANLVPTLHAVSKDCTLEQMVVLSDGRSISEIDHQRLYLEAAQKAFTAGDAETEWVLSHWESTLEALEKDPMQLSDRIDWVTKKWLLETFMEAEGCGWDDPRLPGLDLEYHNIDPERGLFLSLEAEGEIRRFVSEEAIQHAMDMPPLDTRAGVRGLIVQKFLKDIHKIQWEKVLFKDKPQSSYSFDDLFDTEAVRAEMHRLKQCQDVASLFVH